MVVATARTLEERARHAGARRVVYLPNACEPEPFAAPVDPDPVLASVGRPLAIYAGAIDHWFDTAAFAVPAAFTFGNAGRNLIDGPGLANLDLAVYKGFRFNDRFRAQFRWELLDAMNTPQFTLPAESFGGAGFGVVSGTDANSRRIMQLGLKLYW